jgi:hypothetical protein
MTEKTIKDMARELAGAFYEDNRSPGFRATFPTLKAYMRGQWHKPTGEIFITKPGWMYHIDLAIKVLGTMLGKPDAGVSPAMKERIAAALIENHNKGTSPQARKTGQRLETHH